MQAIVLFLILSAASCIYPVCTSLLPNLFDGSTDAQKSISGVRNESDVEVLLNGVGSIPATETLGFFSVYGSNAFPVVSAPHLYNTPYHPVIAAGRLGKGRLVGGTHHQLFMPRDNNNTNLAGKHQLVLNMINWVKRNSPIPTPLLIGFLILGSEDGTVSTTRNFLSNNNIPSYTIKEADLQSAQDLDKFDVVFVTNYFKTNTALIFREYLENGGGMIIALNTWNWEHDGHFGADFPTNILSSHAGFVWRNKHNYAKSEPDKTWSLSLTNLKNTHVQDAWNCVKELSKTFNEDLKNCGPVVEAALDFVPPKDSFWVDSNFYTEAIHLLLRKAIL